MEKHYREYNAWLQPYPYILGHPLRLEASKQVTETAKEECIDGMRRLFGSDIWQDGAPFTIHLTTTPSLPSEGYRLSSTSDRLLVEGADENGVLYGVFALLRAIGTGKHLYEINEQSAPAVSRRVINHWDRIDGSIERGYAGNSIFFQNGRLCYNPDRIRDYARLLASIGINVMVINNVNVTKQSTLLMTTEHLPKLAGLADIFRPYGVRIALSVHFDSPVLVGNLTSSDPLDSQVAAWWQEKTDEIYRYIPDFAGYLVKADSEFQSGPASHGRSQADGANMLARALKRHDGVVFWRCFIYNCLQDWRDTKTDRAKAAYELFKPLDGLFDSNVILQIKNGPVDFQVREPNSPLFGALEKTRTALELQITQEYTGQQIDLYNLAVQWEEVFSFPVDEKRALRNLVGGRVKAVVGVSNVGDDENWTGHTLAQANLYAFGRLAWDPALTAKQITAEWVMLTFGNEPTVVDRLTDMMLRSRAAYEKYTSPLGLGWMVNINHHYGPSPEGYEYMKWGTYHRADCHAIGVDRTSTGTGFTAQYDPYLTKLFDNVNTCPQELLLFFHRLPYSFVLKNGKTLLQHIYDTHFEGVEDVEEFIAIWDSLQEHLAQETYLSVRSRLLRQLENAKEWRDVINTYFYRFTGIPDKKGRRIYE